jgi:nitrous oxide reductase
MDNIDFSKDILEGVRQLHVFRLIDGKYGCGKIKEYRRRQICRLDVKIRILQNRYKHCNNEKCKLRISNQIAKWNERKRKEMYKTQTNMNPENLR